MQSIRDYLNRLEVWNRAAYASIFDDPTVWRLDAYGRRLKWDDYGNKSSPYGWELDHYPVPKSWGGSDHPSNLRVLHCEKNASLGGLLGAYMNEVRE